MNNESKILLELAKEYAEIASDHRNNENRKLHIAANDLKPIRPVVLLNEIPWSEFAQLDEMKLACEDSYLRSVETHLRRTIYQWKHFPGDMIVPSYFPVTKVILSTGIGVEVREETRVTEAENNIISHDYQDQLSTQEQLDAIHAPTVTYDEAETMRRCSILADIFGDTLPAKPVGVEFHAHPWDDIARYHGVTELLMDLVDRPEFMHKMVDKLTDIFLDTAEQYEKLGLFEANSLSIHCTPALTSDLPQGDFDGTVRMKDVWGRGAAQIFAHVSREMHDEFDIEYMKRSMEPFGLIYYGCCEPLHEKIDLVEKLPNLRKITVTPWADVDVACEIIGKKYVASIKPNPANVASAELDEKVVRDEIGHILNAVKRNGCASDIVLKDISTVKHNPENLSRWEKIVMSMVK